MKQRAHGFTLLEVLFALALFGVLLSLLGTALSVGSRALSKGERYAQRLDEMRAAQNVLRQVLQHTLPLELERGRDGRPVVFDGQGQRLRFSAVLPQALGGRIRVQTLELADTARGQTLRMAFATQALQPWGEPQTLIEGVRDLRLTYRGQGPNGVATGWVERWPWPGRLPQKVRIELTAQGPVGWVPQTIALRVDPGGVEGAR